MKALVEGILKIIENLDYIDCNDNKENSFGSNVG